jgi:hypothetical protein
MLGSRIQRIHRKVFADEFQHRLERVVIYLAAGGLLVHGGMIMLSFLGWLPPRLTESLGTDPISALYTPFSFILIYEVYMFVYHLPESFTISIGKQYEIVALIILRRIFKDIAYLEFNETWFTVGSHNFDLLLDMVTVLIIFAMIFLFYRLSLRRPRRERSPDVVQFIRIKQLFAVILLLVLVALSCFSLGSWLIEVYQYQFGAIDELKDVNEVFYSEFFVVLIYVDVFILILSLLYSQHFSQIMRNSGFIISTVLIRLSFSADHVTNQLMLVGAITFGVLVSGIYNLYGQVPEEIEKNRPTQPEETPHPAEEGQGAGEK